MRSTLFLILSLCFIPALGARADDRALVPRLPPHEIIPGRLVVTLDALPGRHASTFLSSSVTSTLRLDVSHDLGLAPDSVQVRGLDHGHLCPIHAALIGHFHVLVILKGMNNVADTHSAVATLSRHGYRVSCTSRVKIASNDRFSPPHRGAWGQDYFDLWGFAMVQAENAWPISRGEGVTVAVVDTGVDYTHPDLAGQVIQGPNFVNDAAASDPMDDNGHGTHVAGTIAAIADNGIGIAGIAPKAKILAIKVLDATGSGSDDWVAEGIDYAVTHGAKVINLSLGDAAYPEETPEFLSHSIQAAHDQGVAIVAAAGNDGEESRHSSPANDPDVIAVSAVTHDDRPAYFTNFGQEISVAAPGGGEGGPAGPDCQPVCSPVSSVLSLLSSHAAIGALGFPAPLVVGEKYLRLAGTSMASPHVAGAAAIVMSRHPEYSVEQVRQALELGSDSPSHDFDPYLGYGRIDIHGSLTKPQAIDPLAVQIESPWAVTAPGPIDVRGTAGGPSFSNWTLEFAVGAAPSRWLPIATSSIPKTRDRLATWNAAGLAPGIYTLRLTARNLSGVKYEFRHTVKLGSK